MMRAVFALSVLLLLSLPAGAQDAAEPKTEGAPGERERVLQAFTKLVDRGEARSLFGLPKTEFWRREGQLDVALFAENAEALRPLLEGAARPFTQLYGREISVIESGPAVSAEVSTAGLAPEAELVIIVGSRLDLAAIAGSNDFNRGMLARFELGTWPFMFRFEQDRPRRGVVLLANDEPERAREAAFILATVWALGGVTLGPELTGLVEDAADGPALTPRGEAVFGLFFHEELKVGMPLADAVKRAETLLPQ